MKGAVISAVRPSMFMHKFTHTPEAPVEYDSLLNLWYFLECQIPYVNAYTIGLQVNLFRSLREIKSSTCCTVYMKKKEKNSKICQLLFLYCVRALETDGCKHSLFKPHFKPRFSDMMLYFKLEKKYICAFIIY